jgi:diguanylate cyclase (GGDEF)-like protein
MASILSLRGAKQDTSPLEGVPVFRAQQVESGLQKVGRSEWWLWFSALFVAVLSAAAFLLSSIPSFFQHHEHFYEIRSDQARWGILCLLLLFNGWVVYRQWCFRRARRQFMQASGGQQANGGQISDSNGFDPATGLYSRVFIEQQLGKEIARAKRQNSSLSLATVHLDEFSELNARYGPAATDLALKELARRLKKACRGSDFAVRWADDDFLLVLPECGLNEVKVVLNRLGALEMNCAGRRVSLAYTTGWVDYQPGDLPGDLLKRASEILHLYESAAKASFSSTLNPH